MMPLKTIQQLKDYDQSKMKFPCIAQVKLDGIFGRHHNDNQFYTRSENLIRGLSVLKEELASVLHGDTSYDGELVIPHLDFFTMNGLIRSFNETPECMFFIFDKPDCLLQYEDRQNTYFNDSLLDLPHVVKVQAHWIKSQAQADSFYDRVLKAGHEGVVYKVPTALYHHGKKYTEMKRVPVKTVECAILTAYEGKGKMEGMLGGFIVEYNGVKVRVGGGPGVDMAWRIKVWQEFNEDPDMYLGQMLKCQYKKKTAKGSMRSPQMLGIRWDI